MKKLGILEDKLVDSYKILNHEMHQISTALKNKIYDVETEFEIKLEAAT